MSKNLWFEGIPWDGQYIRSDDDGPRLKWVEDKDWKRFLRPVTYVSEWHVGHGGDEYGNYTVYLHTPLGSIIWRYPTGHRQEDVEIYNDNDMKEWAVRVLDGREEWLEQYRNKNALQEGCS